MKRTPAILLSAGATLLIGVVAVMLGHSEARRIAAAESKRQTLLKDVARSGNTDSPVGGGEAMRASARDVKSIERRVDHLLLLFRAVSGGSKFATELKWMALFQGLADADAATLREFLLKAYDEPGLGGREDALIPIVQALLMYVEKSPEEGLGLFSKASQIFKDPAMFQSLGEQVVATALGEWGKRDPLAAAEWLRCNQERLKEYLTENARRGLVTAAASRDPRIAFHLLEEAGVSDRPLLVLKIMDGAAQVGDGEVAMSALRAHLAQMASDKRGGEEKSGMEGLAWGLSSLDFKEGEATLRKLGLEQRQLDLFAAGLRSEEGKNGSWLSWMGEHLSQPVLEHEASKRVTAWAENDYQGAGDWLSGLPEGNLRQISTQAYAQAAAKYDPETAAQWAATLPIGKRRDDTLRAIYWDWPDDVPGKAAFVTENGLE